jgi:hypothetical protein
VRLLILDRIAINAIYESVEIDGPDGLVTDREEPHPTSPLSHLKIDNNSLNSYHTTERIGEYVDLKALIKTGFGL